MVRNRLLFLYGYNAYMFSKQTLQIKQYCLWPYIMDQGILYNYTGNAFINEYFMHQD